MPCVVSSIDKNWSIPGCTFIKLNKPCVVGLREQRDWKEATLYNTILVIFIGMTTSVVHCQLLQLDIKMSQGA